jgi:hypothetical protein
MKIKGPGEVSGTVDASPAPTEPPTTRFADRLDAAPAAADDIASALRTGELDPARAMQILIERSVDQQLGPGAPPAVRQRLVEAMTELVQEDPLLLDKLQRLEARLGPGPWSGGPGPTK